MEAITKKQVNYRKGDDTMACSGCTHFLAPDKCDSVSGIIAPNAVCDLFEAKEEKDEGEAPGGMDQLMSELFGPENKEEQEEQ